MSTEHIFTISELSDYIKTILISKKIKVTGEVSQPQIRGGHLYFSLKDDNSNIKSIIWKSKNINKDIVQGSKVTIDCNLDYYNGSINLIVNKIIVDEEKGDLFKKYDMIKSEFTKKGYFAIERKKKLPEIIKNILIITSANGAALQDFLHTLGSNQSNINYEILDVVVQGIDCPRNICIELEKLYSNNYDIIVITRGGGSFEDLFGFSQPELIEAVYKFPQDSCPILSAIGHKVDNPLIDLVADITIPTPSLAAQYLIDHNRNYLRSLEKIQYELKAHIIETINNNINKLDRMNDKLNRSFIMFNSMKNSCKDIIKDMINNNIVQLKFLELRLDNKNTKKSSNIILYNNDIKIDSNDIIVGNDYIMRWNDIEYIITIKQRN